MLTFKKPCIYTSPKISFIYKLLIECGKMYTSDKQPLAVLVMIELVAAQSSVQPVKQFPQANQFA